LSLDLLESHIVSVVMPHEPELLPIGRFARATGLSIGALRHYADLELLVPAAVDSQTGYRYYRSDQFATAALIGTLRDLAVPLSAISAILAGPPSAVETVLRDHLTRTEASMARLQRLAHRLRMLLPSTELSDSIDLSDKEKIMPPSTFALDPDDERRLAATLFNRVWDLLEKPDRSVSDNDDMIHAAHASRHHWGVVGTPMHWARGEWQCSRVYSVLGRFEPALHHARRCLTLATENELSAFDIGCGHEALARAYRVAGDPAAQAAEVALGDEAAALIEDREDRKILTDDLDALRTVTA
jgi:DNA-binding transcriptional MerR regulator